MLGDLPQHWLGTMLAALVVAAAWASIPPAVAEADTDTNTNVQPAPAQSSPAEQPLPVYQWTDASGMQYFSNEPPPAGVEYREISGELRAIRIRVEQPPAAEADSGVEAQAPAVDDGGDRAMNAQRLSYCAGILAQIGNLERHLQEEQRAEMIDRLVLALHRYEARHRAECR